MKHMINAAEPVDAVAIADFYATFRPFGLPDHVVVPTYGLAEHTVFVCSAGRTLLLVNKQALELGSAEVAAESVLGQDSTVTTTTEGSKSIILYHDCMWCSSFSCKAPVSCTYLTLNNNNVTLT